MQIEDAKALFAQVDTDRDQKVTIDQTITILTALGLQVPKV